MTDMKHIYAFLLILFVLPSNSMPAEKENIMQKPPTAKIIPHSLEKHGDIRTDNYYWLNERTNPEVIDYLKAENTYTEEVMKPTKGLQEKLFNEMKSKIKKDDSSVPYRLGNYHYYRRYEEGKEYPIHCRKKGSIESPEEIILDVNELAKNQAYYRIAGPEPDIQHDVIAFAADTTGRRIYTIYFKDLKTGKILDENIPGATGSMEWANDGKNLFYTRSPCAPTA